jgi:AcrR family transcriptional regulator
LKEEMRKRIIDEALKEFLRLGYTNASVRTIVKNAGTSVGNFYKYFGSKEDLYEKIIDPVYKKLIKYLHQFSEVEVNEQAQAIFYELMEKVIEIFEENCDELSMLLNSSTGSKYENCRQIFIDFITNTVTTSFEYELYMNKRTIKDNFIIELLAHNLVDDIAIILRKKKNKTQVRKLIVNLIDIFYGNIIDKLDIQEI